MAPPSGSLTLVVVDGACRAFLRLPYPESKLSSNEPPTPGTIYFPRAPPQRIRVKEEPVSLALPVLVPRRSQGRKCT